MPRFIIGNGQTGQCVEVEARSVAAACHDLGWAEAECEAVRVGQSPESRRPVWIRYATVLSRLFTRRPTHTRQTEQHRG